MLALVGGEVYLAVEAGGAGGEVAARILGLIGVENHFIDAAGAKGVVQDAEVASCCDWLVVGQKPQELGGEVFLELAAGERMSGGGEAVVVEAVA